MLIYRLIPPSFDEAQYFLEIDLGISKVKYSPHRDNGAYTLDVFIRMQEKAFLELLQVRDQQGIWEIFKPQKLGSA